jgi:hypothetical protein
VQVDSSWNFNDSQTVTLSGSVGGSWTFQNTMGANGTAAFGPAVIGGQGQNYGGGPVYTVTAVLSGIYLGPGGNGTASVTSSFALPARPPNVPTNPGVAVDSVTATSARVVVFASDGRGAAVDAYQTAISLPGGNWGGWSQSWFGGTGTATGLQPNTYYECAAQAHNWVGWSGWTYSSFTTAGTAPSVPLNLAISNLTQTGARASVVGSQQQRWRRHLQLHRPARDELRVHSRASDDHGQREPERLHGAHAEHAVLGEGPRQQLDRVERLHDRGVLPHADGRQRERPVGNPGAVPDDHSAGVGRQRRDRVHANLVSGERSGRDADRHHDQDVHVLRARDPVRNDAGLPVLGQGHEHVDVTSDISIPCPSSSKAKHRAVIGGVEVPMDFRAA